MAIEENKKETVRAVSFANMPPRLREKALKDLEAQQLQEGKSPKDFAWEQFVINQMDFDIAEKLLTQYMSERRREGYNKDVLYKELFTAFSQGSGEVKKNSKFRDYMASVIATGDNINLMQEIAAYYEKNKLTKSIPSLYYKMYEIYFNGKGVNIDLDKAVKYLKLSVEGENTEEKRNKLREIYAKLSNESNEEKRLEVAYEKAVSEKIKSAGTDYANYLMEHNKKKKAVQYLVADEEYKLAYYAVNIESESSINNGVKAFQDVPPANEFKKSLQLMKDRFGDLKTILRATKPASYTGILWRYFLFNYLYIPYHTFRLNQMAFILSVLTVILVPIGVSFATGLDKNKIYVLVVIGILLWGLVLFCVDLWRRYKFARAEDLWKRLEYHIQLESRKAIFEAKAENEKLTVAKKVLTGIASLVGFIATLILGATIHQAVVNDWNLNDNISSAVVTSASDTKVTEEKKSDIDAKTAKDIKTTKTAKEENAPAKAKTVTMEKFNKNGYQFTYPSTAEITEQKGDPPYKEYRIQLADNVFIWVTRFKINTNNPEIWIKDRRSLTNDALKSKGLKPTCSLEILNGNSYILKYEDKNSIFRECYYTFNKNKDGSLIDYVEIANPIDVTKEVQEQIDTVRKSIRFEKL